MLCLYTALPNREWLFTVKFTAQRLHRFISVNIVVFYKEQGRHLAWAIIWAMWAVYFMRMWAIFLKKMQKLLREA